MKRGELKRDWSLARDKIDSEGRCRVCGDTTDVEAAHVISRKAADVEILGPRGGRQLLVKAEAVIPLCGGFSENNHHGQYDARELDILGLLSIDEQLHAVDAAGGIELARMRLCPSEYRKSASAREARKRGGAA